MIRRQRRLPRPHNWEEGESVENLKFNDGFKSLAVNGDESRVIRFNPTDFGITDRMNDAVKSLEKIFSDEKDYSFEEAKELDAEIRKIINGVFASDVCTAAFGETNCLSIAGGKPVALNFLEAMAPYIRKISTEERKLSEKKIKKYTDQL